MAKGISKAFSEALAKGRKASVLGKKPNPSRTHGKSCKCDLCRRRRSRAEARDRELVGVPAGRHATATAGTAPPRKAAPPKQKQVTLRDLVREADSAGCKLELSLGPKMSIGLIAGKGDLFEVGFSGIEVRVITTVEDGLVFELRYNDDLVATTPVAAHLEILG